jgi:two-component system, chemotaxis family, chemotaxis protein CheY
MRSAVLIVEDADTCAATLDVALAAIPGIQVVLATSGLEALQLMDDESRRIHLVITDLNMPGMDGFELIRRIRTAPAHAHVPVIVISGDTGERTPELAFAAGANAYFHKPYSPAAVRQKVELLLHANQEPDL